MVTWMQKDEKISPGVDECLTSIYTSLERRRRNFDKPEVILGSDEDDWNMRTEVTNFRDPFLADVLVTVKTVDGVADDDDVTISV